MEQKYKDLICNTVQNLNDVEILEFIWNILSRLIENLSPPVEKIVIFKNWSETGECSRQSRLGSHVRKNKKLCRRNSWRRAPGAGAVLLLIPIMLLAWSDPERQQERNIHPEGVK